MQDLAEKIDSRPELANLLRFASAEEQISLIKENFPDITDDSLKALQAEANGQEGSFGAGQSSSLVSSLAESLGKYFNL
jgi:hypothetical protein